MKKNSNIGNADCFDLESVEGYLSKKSRCGLRNWKKKYCKLSNKCFSWYKFTDQQRVQPFGILNFDQILVNVKYNPDKYEFTLIPSTSKKEFRIKAYNASDYSKWSTNIQKHIELSVGYSKKLTKLA